MADRGDIHLSVGQPDVVVADGTVYGARYVPIEPAAEDYVRNATAEAHKVQIEQLQRRLVDAGLGASVEIVGRKFVSGRLDRVSLANLAPAVDEVRIRQVLGGVEIKYQSR